MTTWSPPRHHEAWAKSLVYFVAAAEVSMRRIQAKGCEFESLMDAWAYIDSVTQIRRFVVSRRYPRALDTSAFEEATVRAKKVRNLYQHMDAVQASHPDAFQLHIINGTQIVLEAFGHRLDLLVIDAALSALVADLKRLKLRPEGTSPGA